MPLRYNPEFVAEEIFATEAMFDDNRLDEKEDEEASADGLTLVAGSFLLLTYQVTSYCDLPGVPRC